ncbi:unnamed protein product [Linum trigynum]|uniref:Uncharacterized protein n=1 Tax=Linum trigynum TaxID=586398 RepID=A0AAV2FRH8_9ROSI
MVGVSISFDKIEAEKRTSDSKLVQSPSNRAIHQLLERINPLLSPLLQFSGEVLSAITVTQSRPLVFSERRSHRLRPVIDVVVIVGSYQGSVSASVRSPCPCHRREPMSIPASNMLVVVGGGKTRSLDRPSTSRLSSSSAPSNDGRVNVGWISFVHRLRPDAAESPLLLASGETAQIRAPHHNQHCLIRKITIRDLLLHLVSRHSAAVDCFS